LEGKKVVRMETWKALEKAAVLGSLRASLRVQAMEEAMGVVME